MDILTTQYESVKKLIQKAVTTFHNRHGGDREEMLAEATTNWCKWMQRFDPERSKLTTWSYKIAWWGLCEHKRQLAESPLISDRPDGFDVSDHRDNGFLERLKAEVSADARLIIRLSLRVKMNGDNLSPQNSCRARRIVRRKLERAGWSSLRIDAGFNEIREALQ